MRNLLRKSNSYNDVEEELQIDILMVVGLFLGIDRWSGLKFSLSYAYYFIGVEIAGVASSAPSWLLNFAPSTTFPCCRIGSYDILIGSKNGSSLAVTVTFSLSRASSAKSR
ncbi:hypothetical protein KFK09_015353 [Dendrobium nobile]|uniref:Uncharacterized protein n=1 Tax=Dendrobium nobile TaxID=94219 RepID=A0A8T3B5P9_DENNO|nr:hypothetical protein KFK09_015353 [Dendrobium nobile]